MTERRERPVEQPLFPISEEAIAEGLFYVSAAIEESYDRWLAYIGELERENQILFNYINGLKQKRALNSSLSSTGDFNADSYYSGAFFFYVFLDRQAEISGLSIPRVEEEDCFLLFSGNFRENADYDLTQEIERFADSRFKDDEDTDPFDFWAGALIFDDDSSKNRQLYERVWCTHEIGAQRRTESFIRQEDEFMKILSDDRLSLLIDDLSIISIRDFVMGASDAWWTIHIALARQRQKAQNN